MEIWNLTTAIEETIPQSLEVCGDRPRRFLPKVLAFRTHAGAKDAMEADIKQTLDADDPAFDAEDLTREDDDHASLGDEVHWRIERIEIKD